MSEIFWIASRLESYSQMVVSLQFSVSVVKLVQVQFLRFNSLSIELLAIAFLLTPFSSIT